MSETSQDQSSLPAQDASARPIVERCAVEILDKQNSCHSYTLRRGSGLTALNAQKSPIEFDCMEADCGICVVKVLEHPENLTEMTTSERDFLKAMHADADERLACQCRVLGAVRLKVEY